MLGRGEHFLRPSERLWFGASERWISLSEASCCCWYMNYLSWHKTNYQTHCLRGQGTRDSLSSCLTLWRNGQAWFASPTPERICHCCSERYKQFHLMPGYSKDPGLYNDACWFSARSVPSFPKRYFQHSSGWILTASALYPQKDEGEDNAENST